MSRIFEDVNSQEFLDAAMEKEEFHKAYELPRVVILDSEYCSMGRMIASTACKETGYTYYDEPGLLELAGAGEEVRSMVQAFDRFLETTDLDASEVAELEDFRKVKELFTTAVQKAVERGRCLIHERAVPEMTEGYRIVRVLMYADSREAKRARAKTSPLYRHLETEEALDAAIVGEDRKRRLYHDASSRTAWGDKGAYDFCLNTETLGREKSIRLLTELLSE